MSTSETLEDPPYALDSVFRPETHRAEDIVLPRDPRFVRNIITGGDIAEFSYFGEAVAIDGDIAAIGAPYADVGWRTDAGTAYLFRRSGDIWIQEARLTAPHPQPYERFGMSIAVSGYTVIVGADRSDKLEHIDSGAAYTYERRGSRWKFDGTLIPSRVDDRAAAGFSVAAQRRTVVVGAPGADGTGAAFVFQRRNGRWIEGAKLTSPAPSSKSGFGHAVAIDGDAIVVGAITASDVLTLAGAAHVFRREGVSWGFEATLDPGRREALARFGAAVAIRGDHLLVSAPRATVGSSTRAGVVWLFEKTGSGWHAVQELTSDPPRSDEEFGRALSLSVRGAVIGSQFADAAGLNTGGAILYGLQGSRLVRVGTLLAHDLRFMNEFAFAIATSDADVVIGAPRRGENDNATGYAYIYRLEP